MTKEVDRKANSIALGLVKRGLSWAVCHRKPSCGPALATILPTGQQPKKLRSMNFQIMLQVSGNWDSYLCPLPTEIFSPSVNSRGSTELVVCTFQGQVEAKGHLPMEVWVTWEYPHVYVQESQQWGLGCSKDE